MKLMNTTEAAGSLGVSVGRVRQLIAEGKLAATNLGRAYAIEASALESVTVYGKAGRPPKPKTETEKAAARRRVRKKDPTWLLKTLS